MNIGGVAGMTAADAAREVQNGGKFVVYQYCISLLIVTLKRSSDVYFIKPGTSAVAPGIGYTILSLLLGWWGFPWGPIWTIQSLVVNLGGGRDVTKEVSASMVPLGLPFEERTAIRELVDQRRPAQAPAPAPGATCAFCGAQLSPGTVMCGSCGTTVKRQRRTLPFATFVGGGLAVVAVAVLGLQLWSRSASPVSAPTTTTQTPKESSLGIVEEAKGAAPGYTWYISADLGFSGEYPEGWEVEVEDLKDPDTGEALGKVAGFYTPFDFQGGSLQLLGITVQIIAAPEASQMAVPSDEEYRQFMADWVTQKEEELVTEPTLTTVDGYNAVQGTYTGTDPSEQYSVVAYGTFFLTEDRFFFIEGVGAEENQAEMRSIYDHFLSTFDVLPLP